MIDSINRCYVDVDISFLCQPAQPLNLGLSGDGCVGKETRPICVRDLGFYTKIQAQPLGESKNRGKHHRACTQPTTVKIIAQQKQSYQGQFPRHIRSKYQTRRFGGD